MHTDDDRRDNVDILLRHVWMGDYVECKRCRATNEWQYYRAKRPITKEAIERHLTPGGPHIAIYPMAPGCDTTQFTAFDIDDKKGVLGWEKVCDAARGLEARMASLGIHALVVRSGGGHGLHLLAWFDQPQPAGLVRELMSTILEAEGLEEGELGGLAQRRVEIFPKKERVEEGECASAIALPFGRNSILLGADFQPSDQPRAWPSSAPVSLPYSDLEIWIEQSVENEGQPSQKLIIEALRYLSSDGYWLWVLVGLALKHSFGDAGFSIWNEWSKRSEKYDGEERARKKWDRFKPRKERGVTAHSILRWARDAGWEGPPLKKSKQKRIDILQAIIGRASLFHTPERVAFADIEVDGHRETHSVGGAAFRDWLQAEHFRKTKEPIGKVALENALKLAEGQARFDAPEQEAHLRVARVESKIYIDLCDERWRAIEVDAEGWRLVERPPIRFRRAPGMSSLPEPQKGGKIDDLREFLNVDNNGFVLAVAWMLGALSGNGPYPVLAITGEQGSAKSTFSATLRSLVDPNRSALRALPRHDQDLYITATNSHVLAFDNVSKVPEWLSDTLCRLATGGGFAVRKLYTDTDEVLFNGSRPVVLNGIEDFVERPDLADRVILISLENITSDQRRPEAELRSALEAARPQILGSLCDGMAQGLRERPNITLDDLPRMADFALWSAACEGAFWEEGTFERAYEENRNSGQLDLLDTDTVAIAVGRFAESLPPNLDGSAPTEWAGTATGLLGWLNSGPSYADEDARRDRRWPRTPRALSGRLRRMAPVLRQAGIRLDFEKKGGVHLIRVGRLGRSDADLPL